MSAFLVTKRHINALVTGLGRFGLIGDEPARIVGHDLWRENLRSVRYRYPHHDNKHAVDGYDFTFVNVNTAQGWEQKKASVRLQADGARSPPGEGRTQWVVLPQWA